MCGVVNKYSCWWFAGGIQVFGTQEMQPGKGSLELGWEQQLHKEVNGAVREPHLRVFTLRS